MDIFGKTPSFENVFNRRSSYFEYEAESPPPQWINSRKSICEQSALISSVKTFGTF